MHKKIEFRNYNRSTRVPFVIYADFRAFTELLDTCQPNPDSSYVNQYQKRMIYGEKEEMEYNTSGRCHICGKGGFDNEVEGLQKVRDHCHFTGKFRGAAHSKCNLQYRKPKFIPIIFHGMSNYDSHLFIKKLKGNKKYFRL